MGQIGKKTMDRVVKYANQHLPLKNMNFSSGMKLRIMIAEQLFQLYASNRVPITRPPRKVLPQVADRVYQQVINSTDPDIVAIREELGLTASSKRSYFEMTNDIEVYECFRHIWGIDTKHHAKAACEEGAYALMEMGQINGDARALKAGIDSLSKLHNDFQEDVDDHANTAQTEIDFIADVTLVRPDATNISRSEIDAFKRKYGAYISDAGGIDTLIQNDEGVYESPEGDEAPDDNLDYFERIEREQQ